MSEEEIHSKKVSDDNLSETTQRSEQIKKTTKSVKSSSNKLSARLKILDVSFCMFETSFSA
jgi:hypothetical protein